MTREATSEAWRSRADALKIEEVALRALAQHYAAIGTSARPRLARACQRDRHAALLFAG